VSAEPPLLEMEGLEKHFPLTRSLGETLRRGELKSVHAVDGVSIAVRRGETLGLIGESGSGKTTLGWLIARLHEPTAGVLRFRGQEITHLAGSSLRIWRKNVQIVFQDPVGSLDPRLRVWQIVGEPLRAQTDPALAREERRRLVREYEEAKQKAIAANRALELRAAEAQRTADRKGEAAPPLPAPTPLPPEPVLPEIPDHRLSRAEVRARVREVLPTVGLPPDCLDQYPHEFSGGGRQRLSLARALIVHPALIVLDEPTSALDVAVQAQILNRLVALQRELGVSYVLITHNVAAVRFAADRVAVMYLGQLVEVGAVREVLEHPVHPYTKALLAAVPFPDPARRRTRYRVGGDIPSLVNPKPGCRFAARCPFVIDRCRVEDPPLATVPGLGDRLVACLRAEEVRDIAPETLLATAGEPLPGAAPAP